MHLNAPLDEALVTRGRRRRPRRAGRRAGQWRPFCLGHSGLVGVVHSYGGLEHRVSQVYIQSLKLTSG